jgi:4'-phosphopantetheinyl transferase
MLGTNLDQCDVQLVFSSLQADASLLHVLSGTLSSDERGQANRFVSIEHRDAYVVARGLLRLILSSALGCKPELVPIVYGQHGKPAIDGRADLTFNLSHSGNIVVYALSRRRQLGVDVEYVRPIQDLEDIARRFFCPAEYEQLLHISPEHKLRAFYNCWTRKEAFVKATGEGASHPLDAFQVTLLPGEPARFVSIDGRPGEHTRWSLHDISPSETYVSALAIDTQACRLQTRIFKDTLECARSFMLLPG